MSKRPALGSGLSALMGGAEDTVESSVSTSSGITVVSIENIIPNPDQPRKNFDEEALSELAASIKDKGVIQPIIVEKSGDRFIIIAGERRYRASKLAGLKEMPVIERNYTNNEKLEIALIENIQREDLNPIEEAIAYKELMDIENLNQEELAEKVGKKRSTVANSLRLLKLPEEVQNSLVQGIVSAGHARAILSMNTSKQMSELHQRILDEGLSVREAEKLAGQRAAESGKKSSKSKASGTAKRIPELEVIKEKLIDRLGTKININGSLNQGKIEISYYSMEDLERLFDLFTD